MPLSDRAVTCNFQVLLSRIKAEYAVNKNQTNKKILPNDVD
jgi:hypothetical protein